ncbi:MAG: SPOR domain-containing protein [Robiginitomaculum sp.]|nr:SPOR domain-containing protein [Robiginitomaculum sp.]
MENEPQDAYLPSLDGEELQPFDVRAQSSRAGMMKIFAGVAFILVLIFVVIKLFASGTRDRDQTPLIQADTGPYKEVPVDRGGTETPNQDIEIFDVSNEAKTSSAITTTPVAEEPLPKPIPKPAANVVIKQPQTTDTRPASPKPVADKPVIDKPVIDKPVALAAGNYVVQVASLRSQAEAEKTWSKLSKSMNDILTSSQFADIKRVDLGTRGIYYRLRVSGLANRDTARRLCSRLKNRKQNCIVTRK